MPCTAISNPDCTILLDVPVRVGLERMQARRGAVDRFEIESAQFFDRVRNRYLELARADPRRFRVIDATAKLDEVCDAALAALEECLELDARGRHVSMLTDAAAVVRQRRATK